MIGQPNGQKPARPIEATKHEHSANDQKKPYEANPDQLRGASLNMPGLKVISERDASNSYEEPTDDRDGKRTFVHCGSDKMNAMQRVRAD